MGKQEEFQLEIVMPKVQTDLFGDVKQKPTFKKRTTKAKLASASQIDIFSEQVVQGKDIQVNIDEVTNENQITLPNNNFSTVQEILDLTALGNFNANKFQAEWDKLKGEFENEIVSQEPEFFKEEDSALTEVPRGYNLESISQDVPCLTPAQKDDLLKAEQVLCEQDNKGIMFTNGTGTGKTYLGLGIIKRFELRDKQNTLIIVPSDVKAKDWIVDGKDLDLNITQLKSVKDSGSGIVITTYANLRQNEGLLKREFDLVICDESHK